MYLLEPAKVETKKKCKNKLKEILQVALIYRFISYVTYRKSMQKKYSWNYSEGGRFIST